MSLDEPAFNQTRATVNTTTLPDIFQERVLETAWDFIKTLIFNSICPGVQDRPSTALEAVSQDYKDANGNITSYSVQAYYGHVMNALRAFGMRPTYDYDAVTHFVNNLSP